MDEVFVGEMIASTLRLSTPLIFCALAGLLSERSGVVDIGLEGKMLFAAFAAGATGAVYGSTMLAVLAAMLVATALSWLHGLACVSHRGDQVVSGVAINIVAAGMTVVLGVAWFAQGGQTPPVSAAVRITALFPGAAGSLQSVPLLGPVIGLALSPFSKLFEYDVRGTLGKPTMELRYVPGFLLAPLRPIETIKSLFPGEAKKPEEPAKAEPANPAPAKP